MTFARPLSNCLSHKSLASVFPAIWRERVQQYFFVSTDAFCWSTDLLNTNINYCYCDTRKDKYPTCFLRLKKYYTQMVLLTNYILVMYCKNRAFCVGLFGRNVPCLVAFCRSRYKCGCYGTCHVIRWLTSIMAHMVDCLPIADTDLQQCPYIPPSVRLSVCPKSIRILVFMHAIAFQPWRLWRHPGMPDRIAIWLITDRSKMYLNDISLNTRIEQVQRLYSSPYCSHRHAVTY